MTEEKTQKGSTFWIFLTIFALILVALWAIFIRYVYHCLITYEQAQPERCVEAVVDRFRGGDLGEVLAKLPTSSRFEDPALYQKAYRALVESGELTYRKAAGSYNAQTPVYDLYAGDTKVAAVSLREKSSQPLMLILTIQEWEVASVKPVFEAGKVDLSISIPNSYTLYVNGIPADERERTGTRTELEEFRYAAAYVTVPALVEYQITGLYEEPELQVYAPEGVAVAPVRIEEGTFLVDRFATSKMDPDLAAYVLKNAKDYSNFFSRDLEGARASTACLRGMFPKDSYYLELAENYRRYDMWMYSAHYAPTFSDEVVENYIRYSQDFFSCEVSFDKKMILISSGQPRHDYTHTRFYYVNVGGSWVIVDMQQILSQEDE